MVVKNGQDSIRNGLYDFLGRHNNDTDIVLIHDVIRPMINNDAINDNIRVCREYGNDITVVPCTEAMFKTFDGLQSEEQVSRDNLKISQTPQSFFFKENL